MSDEEIERIEYVPIERVDALAVCSRCGAVVNGDFVGQTIHDVWHTMMDDRIARAAKWKAAPRIGGHR